MVTVLPPSDLKPRSVMQQASWKKPIWSWRTPRFGPSALTSIRLEHGGTLSIYPPIYLPTYLAIYLSVYLSINLSIYLSIYLSINLSSYLILPFLTLPYPILTYPILSI